MRPITYVLPGFGPQSERSCAELARHVAGQMPRSGDVVVWRWSERGPGLAAAEGAGGGLALAKLLGLGGWAAVGVAAIGALAGLGSTPERAAT